jgi:hypothetical protein
MRRLRSKSDALQPSDPADAKDLVELAARMGIPPDDAVRQVERLISDASIGEWDDARAPVAPRS